MTTKDDTREGRPGWASRAGVGLGGSLLVVACVPRVPATIVIDPNAKPEPGAGADTGEASKPKPRPASTGRDEAGPPRILRAEQLGAGRVRLHFSEALGSVEGVDPNDFRISVFNVYVNPREGYAYAYYYDFGYSTHGQTLRFTGLRAGETQLDLHMSLALPLHYCQQYDYDYDYAPPGVIADSGLFLHYAAGSIPVRDSSGAALADFGADWVIRGRKEVPDNREVLTGEDARQAGRGLIPLECGPQLPDGPR